jgi:hypothetical protein
MDDIGPLAGLAIKPEWRAQWSVSHYCCANGPWMDFRDHPRPALRTRQEGTELRSASARLALAACESLHYLLENWFNQIDEATKYEASTENTLTKLRRFQMRPTTQSNGPVSPP